MTDEPVPTDPVAAVGQLLATLLGSASPTRPVPTLSDYLPTVVSAASPSSRRSYASYWNRLVEAYGERRLDEITVTDIAILMRRVQAGARQRHTSRDGRGAADHLLLAARMVYRCARADDLIDDDRDPARQVKRPRRLPSTRRALTATQLAEINTVVLGGGCDTALDALLLRLHIETACRVGGALNLRVRDLDLRLCLVLLREKGGTQRWQPVSPTLATALARHALTRDATHPDAPLLRGRDHRPITRSRYDSLWRRIHVALPWTATQGVSTHWLRHTTITWVERHYGIARSYAGHTDRKGASTTTYIRATVQETAAALAALTGEPHPLARTTGP